MLQIHVINSWRHSHLFVELADARQVEEELTARAELQDEVELGLALERESQLDDKRVLDVLLHTARC